MEYSLPHAVMAFLQEEHSPNLPKSYFISSSTKSTKITLIYTRRKSKTFKTAKKKMLPNSMLNNKMKRPRSRYSSSSTDDYTQRSQSLQHCKYGSCEHNNLNRRICSSTPGRGYNSGTNAREIRTSEGAAKMATDPVVRNSPMKDHLPLSHFTSNLGDHQDSDLDDSFGILSPNSLFGDKPPTPGRDFSSSNSPRPPTPNASNYASLMTSTKHDLVNPNNRTSHSRSRQPTVDYSDFNLSPPVTPSVRRSNNVSTNQYRKNDLEETVKQADGSRKPHQHLTTDNRLYALPPVTVRSPSPEVAITSSFSRDIIKR